MVNETKRAACVSCTWHGIPSARKTRETCPWCGGSTFVQTGTYALIPWRGDGRYTIDQAVRTYAREGAADRAAQKHYDEGDPRELVVRFLTIWEA